MGILVKHSYQSLFLKGRAKSKVHRGSMSHGKRTPSTSSDRKSSTAYTLQLALNFLTLHDNAYKDFGFHSSLNNNKRSIFFLLSPRSQVQLIVSDTSTRTISKVKVNYVDIQIHIQIGTVSFCIDDKIVPFAQSPQNDSTQL